MSPKIVLFNGPPSCGKDTIAGKLAERQNKSVVVKFAAPLKTVAKHLYCGGNQELFDQMDSPEIKNRPHELFFGKSCRRVQIDISEEYAKRMHGPRVFGKILANTVKFKSQEGLELFLVSDSGFRPEAEELVEQFGAENIILVRIHRDGKDFVLPDGTRDSRDYINLDDYGVISLDVTNQEGQVDDVVNQIANVIQPLLLK